MSTPIHSTPIASRAARASTSSASWKRGFWSLFATQFQGAFSDNVFKFLVMFLILGTLGFDSNDRDRLAPTVGALFALPFLLFSMAGGHLADRYSRRNVVISLKIAEILIMGLGLIGFWFNHVPLLIVVVFLMSTQSACFGPTKYGLLPDLVPPQKLSWSNGVLSLGTFLAIITGTVLAGVLSDLLGRDQRLSGIVLIGLAGVGTLASLGIGRLPAADPGKTLRLNFVSEWRHQIRGIRRDRVLALAILGNAYFWFLGALIQLTVLFYGKDVLRLSDTFSGLLQVALALGIAIGSLAAGYLSGRKIELGLVPLGALGLAFFGLLLARTGLSSTGVAVNLAMLGFFGGFYIVPIQALIQQRPGAHTRGSVIAVSAMFSFAGVFLASCVYYLLAAVFGMTPQEVFLAGGILTLAGTVFVSWLLPESMLRLILWLATHTVYRIKVDGRANLPEKGGALLVSNHLSMLDALLLQASIDRPVRFLMFKGIYDRPWVRPFARIMKVIPISAQVRPREMIQSLRAASDAIRNGEVVCIFAEGQITRIGQMLPFRRGFERIMKDLEAPIVPVCLDDVWGSIFSFESGRFMWKWPRRVPYPVTVAYGAAMPAVSTHVEVRQAVQELSASAWRHRKERMETIDRAFVRTARRYPFRFAMGDSRAPRVRFGTALARTIFLARRLRAAWEGQTMVGILLPPSVAGALVNFAALLLGKVPINLNYTTSDETLAACARQCGLKSVVTSRAFLDKVKLQVPTTAIWIEETAARPRLLEKLAALAMAWLAPVPLLWRILGRSGPTRPDDLATVIFSSGSTGDPKGVKLSNYNIMSNIKQMEQTFAMTGRDRFMGILPFFHSFGFTGTLCLPGTIGVGVVFHPTPLDAPAIGGLARDYEVTFLLATPTFLQLYLRGCEPGDFGGLRFAMAGAEKLPERLAVAFEDKFGIRPLEGYGCTECSPVVAVNTHDFRSAGYRQVGAKRGTIGHPLPGVSVKVVDPGTGEPLRSGESGLLLVKGPNVMQGYLNREDLTTQALVDGWYRTGDIAAIDEDGFLQITDRLSRFSKIGGEMVPHIKIEEKLHEMIDATEQTFVVGGVPDDKKGERLVVLHQLGDDRLRDCLLKLAGSELPNLWKPKSDAFYRVESFPYLGTGKLDLRRIKELAAQMAAGPV